MSILANAKAKAARGNVKEAFKNEAGAIDLASIMVGIIVIGLIGGVIAATVFAVIPWAQDNAAKQQLDSIVAAESAYLGLSADGPQANVAGSTINSYGTKANLASAGLLDLTANADALVYTSATPGYAAAVKSAAGNWFKITDTKTQPTAIGKNISTGAATPEAGAAHTAAGSLKDYAGVVAAG
jgi:type II secretory pathway pseudopilin PulG